MLRLLIEDVTLLKTDKITLHVRLRGGAMRTLVLDRPVPIAQIRKAKPDLVAEIDRLLDDHCDREVADILTRRPPGISCPTPLPERKAGSHPLNRRQEQLFLDMPVPRQFPGHQSYSVQGCPCNGCEGRWGFLPSPEVWPSRQTRDG